MLCANKGINSRKKVLNNVRVPILFHNTIRYTHILFLNIIIRFPWNKQIIIERERLEITEIKFCWEAKFNDYILTKIREERERKEARRRNPKNTTSDISVPFWMQRGRLHDQPADASMYETSSFLFRRHCSRTRSNGAVIREKHDVHIYTTYILNIYTAYFN